MRSRISIKNELPELERVHAAIVAGLDGLGASREFAEEMFLVAEEVLANTISYGYEGDAVHEIELEMTCEDGTFSMKFTDDAAPYDPLSRPAPDLDAGNKRLKNAKAIILICDNGSRSRQCVATLKKEGLESISSLQGGLATWRQDNLPIVSSDDGK